jgi:hypothetical protein
MALVSISEAARLVGKSRSTLYKTYIDTGKLSVQKDSSTQKPVVDTSELIRVFGQIHTTDNATDETDRKIQNATGEKDSDIRVLEMEVKMLREVMAEKDKRIVDQEGRIQDLQNSVRLIADKTTQTEQEKRGFLAKLLRI